MSHFTKIRIRWLIIFGYSLPIFLLLFSSFILNYKVNSASRIIQDLDQLTLVEKQEDHVSFALDNLQTHMQYFIRNPDPDSQLHVLKEFRDFKTQFQDYQQLLDQYPHDGLFEDHFNFIEENVFFYEELIDLIERRKFTEALNKWEIENSRLSLENKIDRLDEFKSKGEKLYRDKQKSKNAFMEQTKSLVWAVTLSSIFASLIMGYMVISLLLNRLNQEALSLAASAGQIAEAMEEQDHSSAEQAIAVNETTTTIEQLKQSSQQSAKQAESAATSVQQVLALALGEWEHSTEDAAEYSKSEVSLKITSNQISQQVQALIQQLDQIYGITNLLTDLAAQTNMLALNASVEAAHSGEEGKGFSVIANEIRKLADDSRSSAQKISYLIADIQRSASTTLKSTESGTRAVDLISSAINEISINVQQISLNAREQASGIAQIMTAMKEINDGIQQTASHIRQTRQGTDQLHETAQKLNRLV